MARKCTIQQFPGEPDSLARLHALADGRIVLCGKDRRPMIDPDFEDGRRVSPALRHPLERVLAHIGGGYLGWIPGDFGYAALDCDRPEVLADVIAAHPPRLILPSRTPPPRPPGL